MLSDFTTGGEVLIAEFLEAIRMELIDYMNAEDRNATGKSQRSLQVTNLTQLSGQLVGIESIYYVFAGRAPGNMPPLSNIIDWCNARGIPRAAAWIIAKNISEAGTKLWQSGRNIFKEIITPEKLSELTIKLTEFYANQIRLEIRNILQAA